MSEKVVAAVLTAPRQIDVRTFDKPELGPRDFLMKVKYCGICASDVHLWNGDWNPPYPLIIGHEFIGEVADAGEEALDWRQLHEGDQIAVEMIIPCHQCAWCQKGYYNLCIEDDRSIALERGRQYGCNIPITRSPTPLWGGYAQYLYVPENALVHWFEKKVDWKEAALTEPLAVSQRAIDIGTLQTTDTVVIVGPGTIGLGAVVAARAAGVQNIILTGTKEDRLKIGERLGADHTVNIRSKDPVNEVKQLTKGLGADVVIETAGTIQAQEQTLRMARKGGTVIIVGLTGDRLLTFNSDKELVSKELKVLGSFLSAHAYQEAIKIIQSQRFQLNSIVSHVYPLLNVEQAYDHVTQKKRGTLKVLLDPWMH